MSRAAHLAAVSTAHLSIKDLRSSLLSVMEGYRVASETTIEAIGLPSDTSGPGAQVISELITAFELIGRVSDALGRAEAHIIEYGRRI
jgi:hypothetical protein